MLRREWRFMMIHQKMDICMVSLYLVDGLWQWCIEVSWNCVQGVRIGSLR